MKKYLILLLISFLFLPSFVFAKENLNKNDKYFEMENPDGVYTVTFNTNGGNSIDSQTVSEGGKASDPGKPVRDGYKFIGWYRDEELTETYNFSDPVTSNITIYAKWNEILTSAGAHITVPVRGKLAPLDIKSDDESKYKDEAFEIAKNAVEAIDGLKGFVGVDLLINNDEKDIYSVYLLEINSRFTTPYVGLKQISNINIGDTIIKLIDGEMDIDDVDISLDGEVEFKKFGESLEIRRI